MSSRIQAAVAFPFAICLFLSIPFAALLPIVIHLQPNTLATIDAAADTIFGQFIATPQPEDIIPAVNPTANNPTTEDTTSTTSTTSIDEAYKIGQVFTHAKFRYQGVIIKVLTQHEKRAKKLKPLSGKWYACLIDIRYKKGGVSDTVLAEHINLIYPGEGTFKHPRLSRFFNDFNKETSSYVPLPKTRSKKKKKKIPIHPDTGL
jgi:hemimethylated DNA binding protein|tara:strand:+ start:127 stop:738 length:612 start_codon:yes stop_codon:yes gene_type:complete